MSLIDKLDKLGWEAGNKIDSLNSGGCCVFASLVANRLSAAGIPVRGIVAMRRHRYDVEPEEVDIDEARKNVSNVAYDEEWEDNNVHFSHVGLEFELEGKLYHYDSHGVKEAGRTLDNMPIVRGRLYPEELEALASVPTNWNYWFNRNQIPKLGKLVDKHLKEV